MSELSGEPSHIIRQALQGCEMHAVSSQDAATRDGDRVLGSRCIACGTTHGIRLETQGPPHDDHQHLRRSLQSCASAVLQVWFGP